MYYRLEHLFGGQLLYLHTIYLITARACGQAMVGGLWTNLSTWPVDKPGYVACGQTWICGLQKPGYVACGQTWVHSLYSNLNM